MIEIHNGCTIRLIKESYPTANKDHGCNASQWMNSYFTDNDFTMTEKLAIQKAYSNSFMILSGDEYIRQVIEMNGKIHTYKAIPSIHYLMIKKGISKHYSKQ